MKRKRVRHDIENLKPKDDKNPWNIVSEDMGDVDRVMLSEIEWHMAQVSTRIPVILPLDNYRDKMNEIVDRIRSCLVLILMTSWVHEGTIRNRPSMECDKKKSITCQCGKVCNECPPCIYINDNAMAEWGHISTYEAFKYHTDIIKSAVGYKPRFLHPDIVRYITMYCPPLGCQTLYVHTCPTVQQYIDLLVDCVRHLDSYTLKEPVILSHIAKKNASGYKKHICDNMSILCMEYLMSHAVYTDIPQFRRPKNLNAIDATCTYMRRCSTDKLDTHDKQPFFTKYVSEGMTEIMSLCPIGLEVKNKVLNSKPFNNVISGSKKEINKSKDVIIDIDGMCKHENNLNYKTNKNIRVIRSKGPNIKYTNKNKNSNSDSNSDKYIQNVVNMSIDLDDTERDIYISEGSAEILQRDMRGRFQKKRLSYTNSPDIYDNNMRYDTNSSNVSCITSSPCRVSDINEEYIDGEKANTLLPTDIHKIQYKDSNIPLIDIDVSNQYENNDPYYCEYIDKGVSNSVNELIEIYNKNDVKEKKEPFTVKYKGKKKFAKKPKTEKSKLSGKINNTKSKEPNIAITAVDIANPNSLDKTKSDMEYTGKIKNLKSNSESKAGNNIRSRLRKRTKDTIIYDNNDYSDETDKNNCIDTSEDIENNAVNDSVQDCEDAIKIRTNNRIDNNSDNGVTVYNRIDNNSDNQNENGAEKEEVKNMDINLYNDTLDEPKLFTDTMVNRYRENSNDKSSNKICIKCPSPVITDNSTTANKLHPEISNTLFDEIDQDISKKLILDVEVDKELINSIISKKDNSNILNRIDTAIDNIAIKIESSIIKMDTLSKNIDVSLNPYTEGATTETPESESMNIYSENAKKESMNIYSENAKKESMNTDGIDTCSEVTYLDVDTESAITDRQVCKGKDICTKGKDICTKGKDICTKGKDICTKGKDICTKGKDEHINGTYIRTHGSDIHTNTQSDFVTPLLLSSDDSNMVSVHSIEYNRSNQSNGCDNRSNQSNGNNRSNQSNGNSSDTPIAGVCKMSLKTGIDKAVLNSSMPSRSVTKNNIETGESSKIVDISNINTNIPSNHKIQDKYTKKDILYSHTSDNRSATDRTHNNIIDLDSIESNTGHIYNNNNIMNNKHNNLIMHNNIIDSGTSERIVKNNTNIRINATNNLDHINNTGIRERESSIIENHNPLKLEENSINQKMINRPKEFNRTYRPNNNMQYSHHNMQYPNNNMQYSNNNVQYSNNNMQYSNNKNVTNIRQDPNIFHYRVVPRYKNIDENNN